MRCFRGNQLFDRFFNSVSGIFINKIPVINLFRENWKHIFSTYFELFFLPNLTTLFKSLAVNTLTVRIVSFTKSFTVGYYIWQNRLEMIYTWIISFINFNGAKSWIAIVLKPMIMAIPVVEFSSGGYKIRKIFAKESTYP